MTGKNDPDRDIVLTPADARVCGFCGAGITDVIGPRGMSLRKFLAGKYTVGMFEDMDDAFATRLAKAARDRVARERAKMGQGR